jgi:hypothetical protein
MVGIDGVRLFVGMPGELLAQLGRNPAHPSRGRNIEGDPGSAIDDPRLCRKNRMVLFLGNHPDGIQYIVASSTACPGFSRFRSPRKTGCRSWPSFGKSDNQEQWTN